MKKKLSIFCSILAVIGFIGFTTIKGGETKQTIEESWVLPAATIKEISLEGGEQPIKTIITKTAAKETTITLSGQVSAAAIKQIKKTSLQKDRLTIPLSGGFKIGITNHNKKELVLNIALGQDAKLKKYTLDMMLGDAVIMVPQEFQGKITANATHGGKVLATPQTTQSEDSLLFVDTSGDISIQRAN